MEPINDLDVIMNVLDDEMLMVQLHPSVDTYVASRISRHRCIGH